MLVDGDVVLRPLRRRDARAWVEVRRRNVEWLREWEATPPGVTATAVSTSPAVFLAMVRRQRRDARRGRGYPYAIDYQGRFVGQLTIGGVTRGSLHSAHLGYWVDSAVAGRGIVPTAVALAVDHCIWTLDLHRVEVNIRPENAASRRVVEKLGFREEGLRRRFLHIAGDWRDHLSFAVTREELPAGMLARWRASRELPTSS